MDACQTQHQGGSGDSVANVLGSAGAFMSLKRGHKINSKSYASDGSYNDKPADRTRPGDDSTRIIFHYMRINTKDFIVFDNVRTWLNLLAH